MLKSLCGSLTTGHLVERKKNSGKTQCFLGRKKKGITLERIQADFAQALEWTKIGQKHCKKTKIPNNQKLKLFSKN